MARAGVLETSRGKVPTPLFMPVATHGAVKALLHEDVEHLGFNMVICNTYHLEVRPGIDVIAGMGGLHKFIGWPGLIATDSGGFQVFSLAKLREVDDTGVSFRSHVDGVIHRFTPENVVERQEKMGSDVAMVLDVCSRADAPREEILEALVRTTEWAKKARDARKSLPGGLFGIVQGGTDHELRRRSATEITSVGFDGYAIGGLSVGEEKPAMLSSLEVTNPLLPQNAPRYLMGVGEPGDVLEAIARGVDMFDCVFPTRVARNGLALTWGGRLVVRNAPAAGEDGPIDPACRCPACTRYGRAYLRHLIRAKEMMGMRLLSLHNLAFMRDMMEAAREAILAGRYDEFRREKLQAWRSGPESL
jgi:queuine tRNA-ribosyltransferase